MLRYLYIIVLLAVFFSCGGKQQQEEKRSTIAPTFQKVTVPPLITDPLESGDYMVAHYWDKFDFTDRAYLDHPAVLEQALVDYIDAMRLSTPEKVKLSIKNTMHKAEADSAMHARFFELFDKYLYDPNSPMRHEEYFIPVLESMITSSVTDEIQKIRPQHLLTIALRNRVGHPATDFTYTLPDGTKRKMVDLKTEYLLIYFYNPDCSACKELARDITNIPIYNELMKNNRLKVLAVYTDEDVEKWKSNLSSYPKDWIQSYDESLTLKEDEIYDLKAIPSVYLLDKDKNVILKDASYHQLEYYLYNSIK